jgi:signal transduction histidine kinase
MNAPRYPGDRKRAADVSGEAGAPKKAAAFWVAVTALVISALLTVFAATFSQSTLNALNEMADKRKAALTGQLRLAQFMSLLKDLETGQRGFVITGRNEYLEPYRTAVLKLPVAYEALVESTLQAPDSAFDWVEFRRTVDARKAQAEAIVVERQQRGEAVLKEPKLFDTGKQIMDQIRVYVATLTAAQSEQINELESQMKALRESSSRHAWLSAILSGLMIMASVTLFILERLRRERLEEQFRVNAALLEQRVADRTEALASASSQIRKFSIKLENSIEAEHRRISREVHDQLGQIFTAIKMIFHSMKPGGIAQDQREAMTTAIDTGVATTRRIAAELRPPLLDDLGLVAALEQYVQGVAHSFKLTGTVKVSGHEVLTESQALQLFRVVQEACTNAGRHAQARNLVVIGSAVEHGFELSIEDDGQGIDPALMRDGALGLVGLRERVAMMGGALKVEGRAGGGTRVWVSIPLHWSRPRASATATRS